MNLGERIYQLRREKQLSQEELAELMEVSRQSVSKWETDASVPELEKLLRLSEIFGVTLDELVLGAGAEKMPENEKENICSDNKKTGVWQKRAGILFLAVSGVAWVMITLFGNASGSLGVAVPFIVCGLLCLLVRRNGLLWCFWAAFFCADLYFLFMAGDNWQQVMWYIGIVPQWSWALFSAWILALSYLALTVMTVMHFRKGKSVKKNVLIAGGLLLLLVLLSILFLLPRWDHSMPYPYLSYYRYTCAFALWLGGYGLTALAVFAARAGYGMRKKK